jgi:hypothetical protein
MDGDTKVEIAGWFDRARVCGMLAQAILGTGVLRPAMGWLAWVCELISA